MINSSSEPAVFKIARSRRYDFATMVEEARLGAARLAAHAPWLCRADRVVSDPVLGRGAGVIEPLGAVGSCRRIWS